MTTKNKNRQLQPFISQLKQHISHNRWKLVFFFILGTIALLTGVIVAIKTGGEGNNLECYNLLDYGYGFWGRLFSMLFVGFVCFGCSFSWWLYPVATILICYRAYLLGIALTWIIICNNFMGIIFSLLIILPCQLAVLSIIILMYLIISKSRKERCSKGQSVLKVLIISLVALVIICIVESLLFALFSPNIILII